MKWQRRRSKQHRIRNPRNMGRLIPHLEWLEERQVLAANVLADVSGSITADASNELAMTVEIPDGSSETVANVSILSSATDGSTLDPAAVAIRDAEGNAVTLIASNDNANDTTAGLSVAGLTPGEYTLVVSGEGSSSGDFQLQVSLLGDAAGDAGQVTQSEITQASAAMAQSLGGNFVTELFYQSLGIDFGVNQFDSGMDVDGDGSLSGSEFSLIQNNGQIGVVNIVMQSDSDGPDVTAALQTDTGVSATDGITSDPTVTGTIADDSEVSAFAATINGRASFDLTTLFDPNASNSFELSASALAQIAGGTLPAGPIELSLESTDSLGNVTLETVNFTFVDGNTAPTSSAISDQTVDEDQVFSLDVSAIFSDADAGDVLTLSSSTLPGWLTFDAGTSTFSGTPENADVGSTFITVTATDSQGSAVSETFSLDVANTNDAPTLSVADRSVNQNSPVLIDLNASASDIDAGDTVTLSFTNLPAWLLNSNGVLTGSPANGDVGSTTVTVIATDTAGATAQDTFVLTVIDVNDAPALVGEVDDQTVDEGQAFSLGLGTFFTDADGDALTLSAGLTDGGALPSWISFDSSTDTLAGTPGSSDLGRISVRVTATDPSGATASDDFLIDVGNVNDSPVATSIPNQTAIEGQEYLLDVAGAFSDPDPGDSLTLSAELTGGGALPSWLTFNPLNGLFTGTPGNLDVGTVSIVVTATDLAGLTATSSFELVVSDVNASPTIVAAISDQTIDQGQALSLDVSDTFADEDLSDVLTLSANNLPSWLVFDPSDSTLTGTPTNADVGTVTIDVVATDLSGASVTDSFDVVVSNVNDAPTIADQTFNVDPAAANASVVGTVVASDIDGDNLTFVITSGDTTTFAIDAVTGEITIADNTAIVEDANFVLDVTVSDDGIPAETAASQITINVVGNQGPTAVDDTGFTTLDSETLEIAVADLLANDTDPDNDTLSISSINSTSQLGASIQLSGNTIQYDPSSSSQLIALHDGDQLTDTFQYTVTDGNETDTAEVTIVVAGVDVVEFTLETTDANGNVLTEIQTGQTFFLRGFVQDVRDNPTGVFSSYLDVEYPAAGATPLGSITHTTTYGAAASGSTATPGLIDEVGGVDGTVPLGGDRFEFFSVEFTAAAVPSTLTFTSNTTEDQVQHPVLLFGATANLDPAQVVYGSTSISVVGPAAALASDGAERDPLDVNDDGEISPLDALLIANHISGSGGANSFMDVNADGSVSPLDMLMVVNAIGQPAAAAPVVAALEDESRDAVFASLDEGEVLSTDSSAALLTLANDDLFERDQDRLSGDSIHENIELL